MHTLEFLSRWSRSARRSINLSMTSSFIDHTVRLLIDGKRDPAPRARLIDALYRRASESR
jgi:hypothetical protein